MFFEYPGVRFSGLIRLWESMVRTIALLLIRPWTQAVRHSFRMLSRPQPAEFSAATHTASQRPGLTPRGSRAADRASSDALRLNYNSVNTEDLYGISITREKLAAPTGRRRFPTEGRRSSLPAKQQHRDAEGSGQEIVLGQGHGLFQRWQQSAHRARAAAAAQQQHEQWLPQRGRRLTFLHAQQA